MSNFILGEKSLKRLEGVNPKLVAVVKRAIEISDIDFTVIEGLRTKERQRYLMTKGATRTMSSRHLSGNAVDLAPLVDGKVTWDWPHYFPMAEAMRSASEELGTKVRWGGAWSLLSDLPTVISSECLSKSFPDGPHFELPEKL